MDDGTGKGGIIFPWQIIYIIDIIDGNKWVSVRQCSLEHEGKTRQQLVSVSGGKGSSASSSSVLHMILHVCLISSYLQNISMDT